MFGENDEQISIIEKIAIILLAICPILQHYKGIYINAAVTVLLIVLPYAAVKLIKGGRINLAQVGIVLPIIISYLFQVIDHGTSITEFGQAVVVMIVVIAIASGCFNTKYFIRVITIVSAAASVLIFAQYICYYIFKFHLQLVPTALLLPRSEKWVLLAQTGRYSVTGHLMKFYRPSAFFLEPSHMFIYMFTPLTISLLSSSGKPNMKVSLLLAAGMILSTSGMGMVTTALLYPLYLGKKGGEDSKFSVKRLVCRENIIKLSLIALVAVIAFFAVPFFRNSIVRIFSSGSDYSNAITGRITSGLNQIEKMHGMQYVFGVKDGLGGITASMSGFNETMFQYGIIGVILSYVFYVRGLFTLKNEFFWVAVIIVALSFFSQHTHSTFFILYETFVFIEGYKKTENKGLDIV